MININILNEILKGVSEQIPLVNSFYTLSPYDSWNVSEVKYGSVSFVVTDIQTRQSTTTYTATLYYGDRLLEDGSNRDSVYSDSATVIQTIVGALNQCDEYIEVAYPVSITLFEQDFVDHIAGGYATLTISSTGMGECFEDELNIPQIVATSAYYTKDEIAEYFPLRTQLSTVAFSGSFSDLRDTPDLVTIGQYNDLIEGVLDGNRTLADGLKQKVSIGYFDEWADNIEKELDYRVKRSDFDNVVTNIETEIDYISENTISQQQYNDLINTVETNKTNLTSAIDKKLDTSYFTEWKNQTETELNNKVTLQQYNNLINAVETTTTNLTSAIDKKLDTSYFTEWKNQTETELNNKVTLQQYNTLVESVIANDAVIADVLKDKVSIYHFDLLADNIESRLDNFNTEISKDYYNKDEVDTKLKNAEVDLSNYYTKSEVDKKLDNIGTGSVDLSNYYTKSQVDVKFSNVNTSINNINSSVNNLNNTIGNINTILNNVLYIY